MRTTTIKPSANCTPAKQARHPIAKRQFWATPIAAAVMGIFALSVSPDAQALALGRISVLSSIGEPLRAEIDVPEITADEAASLRTAIANPDAFKAAGLEYNAAITNVTISLQKRPDGRSFLRLAGDKTVNDPFVDLILEANWSAGRVVRDYTLLFDPPSTKVGQTAAVTAPIISAPSSPAQLAPAATAAPAAVIQAITPAPALAPTAPSRAPAPAKAETPVSAKKPSPTVKTPDGKIVVKPGDTAGFIAAKLLSSGVSLDQMLLALVQTNPSAFISGDVNRVKSGAVLSVPTVDQAAATPTAQAKQMLYAQSKDFNDFRRKLAQNAPNASQGTAARSASGKVQAKVDDKKQASATPDKLTLSKGGMQSKAGSKEDAIAKDKAKKDADSRVAELSKNISDLAKLNAAPALPKANAVLPALAASATKPEAVKSDTTVAAAAGVATGAVLAAKITSTIATSAPVSSTTANTVLAASTATLATSTVSVTTSVSALASSSTFTTGVSASATSASATVVAQAAAPASAPKKTVVKAPEPPPPEPSFVEELMENPLVLPAAGGLIAALGGFAFWRSRQRKKNAQVDSSFLESRLQPDSFFGASGGQRIDTADASASATGSSMVYSPSQLDAAGDVDPVAEADVYLAYGRDLQAEEILKEAMRTNPSRVAVHFKLLEIYAKRKDVKAFEVVAAEAFSLCRGEGEQWNQAAELGRELDPANPMYKPGGQPLPAYAASSPVSAAFAASTMPQSVSAEFAPSTPPDVDLDLDFSLGDDMDHTATSPVHIQPTIAFNAQPEPVATVDFPFEPVSSPPIPVVASAPADELPLEFAGNDLNFSMDDISFDVPPAAPVSASAGNALEFDLGDLSLDLPPLSATKSSATVPAPLLFIGEETGELETKLALAEEFSAIGDLDGARSLAQEVVDFGTGALKSKAQKFIANLA